MSVKSVDAMPCNFQDQAECAECSLEGRLMCHYETRDTVSFFMVGLPFFVTAIIIVLKGHRWREPMEMILNRSPNAPSRARAHNSIPTLVGKLNRSSNRIPRFGTAFV